MKKLSQFIFFFLLGFSFSLPAWAAEYPTTKSPTDAPLQTLSLKDGSVVRGQLIAVEGDSYVIKSENMGTVKVRIADLENLSTGRPPQPAASSLMAGQGATIAIPPNSIISPEQITQMQNQLMADPQLMSLIQEFISDPEVKTTLSDQNLLTDLFTMDPQKVQSNPKMQKLISHPKMQQILKLIQAKNQTP